MFNRKNIFSKKMKNQSNEPGEGSVTNSEAISESGVSDSESEMNLDEAIKSVDLDHIQKLENEISLEKDKLLRLFAEFENYKKRTIRERMDLLKSAGQEVISSLLPVMDDFDRAIKSVTDADATVKEGLMLIHHKLKTILEQKGLTTMQAIGQPFDTDLHEAITNVSGPENMKGKVIDEAEKGYFLNGKVIRHAKVIVGS